MDRVTLSLLAALGAAGAPQGGAADLSAQAPIPASPTRDAEAYCAYVRASAASESAPFLLPSAFAAGGVVSVAQPGDTTSALAREPAPRATVGLAYNLGATGLSHGLAIRSRAEADCKVYATTSQLRAFIEHYTDPQGARSLAAKIEVLDAALPRAAQLLSSRKSRLAAGRMTVEEVHATELRVDALRALAAETRAQLGALAALPPLPKEPIREVVAQREAAEVAAEREEGRLRETAGWDLTLRGGYDRVFGLTSSTPLFGMATLSLDAGLLLQRASDADAEKARRDWVHGEVLGLGDRVAQTVQKLRATRDAQAQRLRESAMVVADFEQRWTTLSSLENEKAGGVAEAIWFDLVRARAEHAYLEANVGELTAVLADGSQP